MSIPEKFTKPYNANDVEGLIYRAWEESGYFNPDVCVEKGVTAPDAPVFSMALPPPNVTGVLHLGHAYEDSVQDVLTRFARMQGQRTVWVPGADSAAIATQSRVEKNIQKEEGKSRYDLGREELVRRVKEFAENSRHTILAQLRRMGSSLDWSRYAYTLDDARYKAVMTAFVRMYEAGLIYRGHRIVNWDPKGQTTISDDEIAYKEEKTALYYLQYGPFIIGTARPETKFGDKYVVMHPDDKRYAQYHDGQKIDLEWINGPITATVIKDAAIDMEFGTGVMTITPWHSAEDFEIAERHDLDHDQIIDLRGKLLPIAGEFAGMKITEAREKIVEKLRAKELLVKEEDYTHNIATSDRTGGVIEPQIMEQWFVAVDKPFTIAHSEISGIESGSEVTLKQIMRTSVESGAITIQPDHFARSYFHWIDNLHDWCISRQIWFGHRIPVWYRGDEVYCSIVPPVGSDWVQDEDVLDTWFSSALWTFSTLGWPEKTPDLLLYHPTSVINPGYELLFLWVSRMILMSGFHLGQVPFRTALIHGIVRDKKGQKFSKSLGNGIDPIEMIEKYGTDALRMGLLSGGAMGSDVRFDEERIRTYKLFANKLWNISRFVLDSTDDATESELNADDMTLYDEFKNLAADIADDLEQYRLHLAIEKIYHYVWHRLADQILEESKPILRGEDAAAKASRQALLMRILKGSLKLLHPFMPFITEEIWDSLPRAEDERDMLVAETWPAVS